MNKKLFSMIALAGLLAFSTIVPGLAADDPGKAVDRLLAAYRTGSVDRMMEVYDPDVVFDDISQRHHAQGAQEMREILARTLAIHKTMNIVEKRRVVQGDTVVLEYEYTGQLDGAALGKSLGKEACPDVDYRFPTTTWYKVRNGQIVGQTDFIDFASLLEVRQKLLAGSE